MTTLVMGRPCCDVRHGARSDEDCVYRVAWSINPHMVIGSVDGPRAIAQHEAFVQILQSLGAEIVALPFVHGAHDSVFAKDSAVILDDGRRRRALIARPRFAERAHECDVRASQLRGLGFDVHRAEAVLEGGDVVVRPELGFAVLGAGIRSCPSGARELERFARVPAVVVELVNDKLFHLDMAFAVLADGTALVCPEALSRRGLAAIEQLPLREVIEVSAVEAERFAINLVEIGRHVVKSADDRIAELLRRRGRIVHVVELDEFQRAGGSAACLVSRVIPDRAIAAASAA